MPLFDLFATDMRASFTDEPGYIGCWAAEPRQSLFETNPSASALHREARRTARGSTQMRFDVPDTAYPAERLSRIGS